MKVLSESQTQLIYLASKLLMRYLNYGIMSDFEFDRLDEVIDVPLVYEDAFDYPLKDGTTGYTICIKDEYFEKDDPDFLQIMKDDELQVLDDQPTRDSFHASFFVSMSEDQDVKGIYVIFPDTVYPEQTFFMNEKGVKCLGAYSPFNE